MADPYAVSTYLPDEDAIRKEIEGTVDDEIKAQTDSINSTISAVNEQAKNAQGVLEGVYSDAQADANTSRDTIKTSYNQAVSAEKGIIGAAADRLNQLKQSQSAQAQQLAQNIGAPVPLDSMFTAPTELEQALQGIEGAGSLLKMTGLQGASVDHAETFANTVLPLLKAREIADTRAAYDEQIRQLNNEIDQLNNSKSSMVDDRLQKRLVDEKNFALQRVQANRDWYVARSSADLEARRLALQAAEVYGKGMVYDPKTKSYKPAKGSASNPTLGKQQLAAQQKANHDSAVASREADFYKLAEAATNPSVESMDVTRFVPVLDGEQEGAFWNGNQWVRAITQKVQTRAQPITNPNILVQWLIGQGASKQLATKIVKAKFPGFVEGEVYGSKGEQDTAIQRDPLAGKKVYTMAQLDDMSPVQIIKYARSLGFKQKVPKSIRKYGVKYLPGPKEQQGYAGSQGKKKNPDYDIKRYNELVKHFYMYWVQKIYDQSAVATTASRPANG